MAIYLHLQIMNKNAIFCSRACTCTDKSSKAGKDALLLPAGLSAEERLFLPESEERALFFDSLVTNVVESAELLTYDPSPTLRLPNGPHAPAAERPPSGDAAHGLRRAGSRFAAGADGGRRCSARTSDVPSDRVPVACCRSYGCRQRSPCVPTRARLQRGVRFKWRAHYAGQPRQRAMSGDVRRSRALRRFRLSRP